MTEEHAVYDEQKEILINHLCDIFDGVICPLRNLGYMNHEFYCVDVFETDGLDYNATIKNALKNYQNRFVVKSTRQEEKSKIENSIFESEFVGTMSMETMIRNFISAEEYTECPWDLNKHLTGDAKEHYFRVYEEGLQKVLSELHCLGDDPVECYKVTEGVGWGSLLYDIYAAAFSAQYFICGKYLFLLMHGTSE